jgi:hypothetical protein
MGVEYHVEYPRWSSLDQPHVYHEQQAACPGLAIQISEWQMGVALNPCGGQQYVHGGFFAISNGRGTCVSRAGNSELRMAGVDGVSRYLKRWLSLD